MSHEPGQALAATHLRMARIGAPWGVKGWVRLVSYTDPVENLLDYRHFLLTGARAAGAQAVALEIDEYRPQGKGLVGHIHGCDDRDACGLYTGGELWIAKTELPPLEQGYYWHQLEGLSVFTLDGLLFGRVHHLLATGANDVLVVRDDAGHERLLPYVPQVVRAVELEAARILVDWQPDWE
ncbi:MAG TPA: ribosome maturation factor RimM [Hyphomicrobiales bacterium]|nr:ribosome maturation factor RimM [Hyphomicrobiales bacterium]